MKVKNLSMINENVKRIMFLDVINDHLQLKYSIKNRTDQDLSSMLWTSQTTLDNIKADESGNLMTEVLETKNEDKWLSNFEENDQFWHVISTSSVELVYNRKQYFYNQWDQFLGPLSISKYDKFQIQFNCSEGNCF